MSKADNQAAFQNATQQLIKRSYAAYDGYAYSAGFLNSTLQEAFSFLSKAEQEYMLRMMNTAVANLEQKLALEQA